MKIKIGENTLRYNNKEITITRNQDGSSLIKAPSQLGLAYAQGILHANDRCMQMILVRTISQGRLSELLQDNSETFAIDKFMREASIYHEAKNEIKNIQGDDLTFSQAYCDGVNDVIKKHLPSEFKLVGFRPSPWKIEDTLATIKIMSYIGLAQTQQDIEKLIIQMIVNDLPLEKVKRLFTPHLDAVDEKLISTLKKTHIKDTLVPKEIKFLGALPKIVASNNWVVAGELTKSGGAIQCNDPHLECNRLPAIWYEMNAIVADKNYFGITMPGLPGLIMGRNNHISFGFTYGFMDMIDYFIEDIKSEKARTEESFSKLQVRKEIIKRKKHHDEELFIRETDNGIIEYDSSKEIIPDGLYLSRAWSNHKDGSANSLSAIREILECTNAKDFQKTAAKVTISCNWLVADTENNIAYQQSGRMPIRAHSGLHPVYGYKKEWRWQGIYEEHFLASIYNPEAKFIVTANNDMNQKGRPLSINMPMGSYRKDRIEELIKGAQDLDCDTMKSIQTDLFSTQARKYMDLIKEKIKDYSQLRDLSSWDLRYNKESLGATKFEAFYHHFLEEVFTHNFFSRESFQYLKNETNLLVDYYGNFDNIVFTNDPLWFSDKTRESFIDVALQKTQNELNERQARSWGQERSTFMTNIFFDGKLPKFLGFDYGPISLEGNRATIVQGALYRAHGRLSSFCPSWRYISDMKSGLTYSILAGGVSDRRFSGWYTNDVEKWLNFEYKESLF